MLKWKSWFREHILERGYQYYHTDAVKHVSKTAAGYAAEVAGTEDYEVEIELKGDEISEMHCTCPYAADGNYCKHMAAVLYYLEAEECTSSIPAENCGRKRKIQKVLDEMTEEQAKDFLLDLAMEELTIGNRLIAACSKSIGQSEVERLKREVDQIVYRYAARDGFIYYREAYDFINEMENFLYQKGQALIDRQCNMQAFEVVTYVFVTVSNLDMDDSDGGIGMLVNICYELWEQMLENSNTEEKEKIFQWFQEHQEGYVIDFMEEYLSDFLMNHFNDREMLLKKLDSLDAQIAAAGTETSCAESWSARFGYENNILKRLEIMKRLDFSDNEISEYRKKYRNFPAVRELEIEEYLTQRDYEKAIELLVESKELDKAYSGLTTKYSIMLIEIYQKLNLKDQYKDELKYQVFTCRQDNLKYIKMLKKCCPEEWNDNLEKLLTAPGMQLMKYQLLKEEQLYKRLLDEILKSGYIYNLDQYEKCLKKEFPNEVRDAYANYVIHSAETASDRKAYKGIMVYLEKIRKYPQSEKEASRIAEDWKTQYKRRPAMMDELQKAGFLRK